MEIKKVTTWDEVISLPILVLTTASGYGRPRDPDAWCEIEHQAGGYACSQFRHNCIILPIKPDAVRGVTALTDKWLNSCVGLLGGPRLSDANEYSADLEHLGLTCEFSYMHMMEAVYPFDTSPAALRKLTDFPLPDDLDDLLVFESEMEKVFGLLGRWQAYILGENCD